MAITTVTNCKAFREIGSGNQEHDAELARLIPAVQSYLEQECFRTFESGTVTEYKSGGNLEWGCWSSTAAPFRSSRLMVARPPITSITGIWDDPIRVYGNDTLIDQTNYVIEDADAGLIVLDGYQFKPGIKNIKITYVGGFTSIPSDLEQAAIEMVWAAREKGLHNLIGVRSRSVADGNVQFMNLDWGSANLGPIVQKYSLRLGVV